MSEANSKRRKNRVGTEEELNDHKGIKLFKELDPFIDKVIKKLGQHPEEKKVCGMGYFLGMTSEIFKVGRRLRNYRS